MPANRPDDIVELASSKLLEFQSNAQHSISATGELVDGARAAIAESRRLLQQIEIDHPTLPSEQEPPSA